MSDFTFSRQKKLKKVAWTEPQNTTVAIAKQSVDARAWDKGKIVGKEKGSWSKGTVNLAAHAEMLKSSVYYQEGEMTEKQPQRRSDKPKYKE